MLPVAHAPRHAVHDDPDLARRRVCHWSRSFHSYGMGKRFPKGITVLHESAWRRKRAHDSRERRGKATHRRGPRWRSEGKVSSLGHPYRHDAARRHGQPQSRSINPIAREVPGPDGVGLVERVVAVRPLTGEDLATKDGGYEPRQVEAGLDVAVQVDIGDADG